MGFQIVKQLIRGLIAGELHLTPWRRNEGTTSLNEDPADLGVGGSNRRLTLPAACFAFGRRAFFSGWRHRCIPTP